MVNGTVVADLCRFTDHNAHSVVDKQTMADFCAWMNLDPGEKAADLRYQPGKKHQLMSVKPMRRPVQDQRMKSRVQ